MSATDLLARLQGAGCRLRIDGEALRVQDAENALTDALRRAIQDHKPELLKLISQQPATTFEPSISYFVES